MTPTQQSLRIPTRLGLIQLSLYCWLLYSVGPITLLLRDELALSRGEVAMHSSAMALGFTAAGLVSRRLLTQVRDIVLRRAALSGVCIGALALAGSRTLPLTLASVFISGFSGALLVNALNNAVAVAHGPQSVQALAKIHAAAASAGVSAPLLIGAVVDVERSWRLLLLLFAVLVAVVTLIGRSSFSSTHGHERPLTADAADRSRYRVCVITLLAGMVIEFTTALFASDIVRTQTGAATGTATATAASFLAGFAAGRWGAAHLSSRVGAAKIMVSAFALCAIGSAAVATASSVGMAGAGLVVLGLGCGPAYPLLVAESVKYSPQGSVKAVSRIGLLSGLVIGLSPLLLGRLADLPELGIPFLLVALCGTSLAAAALLYRSFVYASRRTANHENSGQM